MLLFVFEFLGTTELLVIALVALIIFGPRKLPEIGRKLGRGMAEFKRASEDFKRTWEYEVELERRQDDSRAGQETGTPRAGLLEENPPGVSAEDFVSDAAQGWPEGQTVARTPQETDAATEATESAPADDAQAEPVARQEV